MAYDDTLGANDAYRRYEEVRHRFPDARFPDGTTECAGLVEISDAFDAVILDSFGVLNVGEAPIPGAADCLAELRRRGKRMIVLTNAASYTRETAVARYRNLGFDFEAHEVVSSRDVAVARLGRLHPGLNWSAIAAPDDRFEDIDAAVSHWTGGAAEGFLFLSSAAMTEGLLAEIENALATRPCPVVVANPDLVAPRVTGLSKEPGYFAHLLADRLGITPVFFGKPYGDAYDDALSRLEGIDPARIAMVGDTLHTDILGGSAAGLKTVLVRAHGLFAGLDVGGYVADSGIRPDFACDAI